MLSTAWANTDSKTKGNYCGGFPGKEEQLQMNRSKGGQAACPQVATLLAFPEPETRKSTAATHP